MTILNKKGQLTKVIYKLPDYETEMKERRSKQLCYTVVAIRPRYTYSLNEPLWKDLFSTKVKCWKRAVRRISPSCYVMKCLPLLSTCNMSWSVLPFTFSFSLATENFFSSHLVASLLFCHNNCTLERKKLKSVLFHVYLLCKIQVTADLLPAIKEQRASRNWRMQSSKSWTQMIVVQQNRKKIIGGHVWSLTAVNCAPTALS